MNQQQQHSVSSLCGFFGLSRWGYYKSMQERIREGYSKEMMAKLVMEQKRIMPRIGGKKLYHILRPDIERLDIHLGRDKFFDVLREYGMLVEPKKRFDRTTNSYHRFHVHKNLIRDVNICKPHQAWVSDITYIRTGHKKFVYLFLITDACSRKIVGWHLSNSLAIEGALQALKMAIKQCPHTKGLIHHSDRGIQYCCKDYVSLLKENNIRISMTEENHCYENSMAERVNGILKDEFMLDAEFKDEAQALQAVRQAINTYNTLRPHWSLNLSTPQQVHSAA